MPSEEVDPHKFAEFFNMFEASVMQTAMNTGGKQVVVEVEASLVAALDITPDRISSWCAAKEFKLIYARKVQDVIQYSIYM